MIPLKIDYYAQDGTLVEAFIDILIISWVVVQKQKSQNFLSNPN